MKPILFNTEMVQAILEGRKSVTRRLIKPRYKDDEYGFQVITTHDGEFVRVEKTDENECGIFSDGTERHVNPPYQVGDILYVRETWDSIPVTQGGHFRGHDVFYYKADGDLRPGSWQGGWRPSIHMPKEGARIFLRVMDVRVERLQDIAGEQLKKEGIEPEAFNVGDEFAEGIYHDIWDSTIKKIDLPLYGWEADPWVWVIEFEQCEKPKEEQQ